MNRKYLLIIAAILVIIVGVLRIIGGVSLLIKGNQLDTTIPIIASEKQVYLVATGLILVGVLLVSASIGLLRNYSKMSWNICWIILLFFLLDGLLNGFLLFGRPLDQGQRINFLAFTIIGLFLFFGKPAPGPGK